MKLRKESKEFSTHRGNEILKSRRQDNRQYACVHPASSRRDTSMTLIGMDGCADQIVSVTTL